LPPFRSQLIIIFISGIFPLVSGSLYAFNINPVQGMDISSFGFLLTDIMLSLGFAHYQLLDLVPVARDTLIREIQDGIIVLDWKNRIVEINQNAKILLNLVGENPIGKNYQELINFPIDLLQMSHQGFSSEYCLSPETNKYIELQVSNLAPLSSSPPGYLLVIRDISIRKQVELKLKQANEDLQKQIDEINHLQEMLKDQATHDSLTNLNNRRLMDEVIAHQLEQAHIHGKPFSILVLDIDHFKNINDYYGHQIGDTMLAEIGKCILSLTRLDDFACRIGGDEILMAFQNMGSKAANKKAEEIRKKLQSIVLNRESLLISTTVSIGIATFPEDGNSTKELINRADQAMYVAKEKGRNQVIAASSVKNIFEEKK
jgi:diguanylate cyclase (GGDEF)-like protein